MTDGEQTHPARHRTGDEAGNAPHRVHLLPAERELLDECHRHRVYLALCGAELPTAEMASSFCEVGCDRMIAYCPECVDTAAGCNADAGLVGSPPGYGSEANVRPGRSEFARGGVGR